MENAEGTLILCKHKPTVASCGGGDFCLKERSGKHCNNLSIIKNN
jgi:hypothetical protein